MKIPTICLLVCPFSFINASCIGYICNTLLKCNHDHSLNRTVSEIRVYFYDYKNNIAQKFPINDAAIGIRSLPTFDRTRKFFVYVGGFKSHINSYSVIQIKKSFRPIPNSYLLIIDHSAYTHSNGLCTTDYDGAVSYVYYIGKRLAIMLAELSNSTMISPKNIHCMGHSLGGQMLGYVGEIFFDLTGERIARITALDPASPCFKKYPKTLQVRSGVADYVEVYHCNNYVLGSSNTIADVDFFVNDGKCQHGCSCFIKPECSHGRCVSVWAQSVVKRNLFLAFQCNNYEMFKAGKCSNNNYTIAGFGNPGYAKGIHYFSTKHVMF